jgi:hypothetical protein
MERSEEASRGAHAERTTSQVGPEAKPESQFAEFLGRMMAEIQSLSRRIDNLAVQPQPKKEWHTPEEVAILMHRKPYTVREWCRKERIRSEKDAYSNRRKIPAAEVERLLSGGGLLSA